MFLFCFTVMVVETRIRRVTFAAKNVALPPMVLPYIFYFLLVAYPRAVPYLKLCEHRALVSHPPPPPRSPPLPHPRLSPPPSKPPYYRCSVGERRWKRALLTTRVTWRSSRGFPEIRCQRRWRRWVSARRARRHLSRLCREGGR